VRELSNKTTLGFAKSFDLILGLGNDVISSVFFCQDFFICMRTWATDEIRFRKKKNFLIFGCVSLGKHKIVALKKTAIVFCFLIYLVVNLVQSLRFRAAIIFFFGMNASFVPEL
jgi:hypothetical protein